MNETVWLKGLLPTDSSEWAAWVGAAGSVVQAIGTIAAIVWAARIARSSSIENDRRDLETRRVDALRKLKIAFGLVRRVAQSVGVLASFRSDPLNTETRLYREERRREIDHQTEAISAIPLMELPSAAAVQHLVAARLHLEHVLELLTEPLQTGPSDHVSCSPTYGAPVIELHTVLVSIAAGLEAEASRPEFSVPAAHRA